MSDNKVRFSAFIREQKPSIQKMRVARLLDRLDKTHFSVYVKDKRALREYLSNILFERSLGVELSNKR